MDVAYENETINEFFSKDDIPICFDQLERYLHEDATSLALTDSSNSATCTPYNQSVASTPIISARHPHPNHSLSASTNAINTVTSSSSSLLPQHQNAFDNPAFVTELKNNFPEVSPRLPDSPPDSGSEAFSPESRDVNAMAPPGYHHTLRDTLPPTSGHNMGSHGNLIGMPSYNPAGMPATNPQQGIMSVSGGVPQGIPMQLPHPNGMDNRITLPQFMPTSSSTDPSGNDNFQRAPSFTSHLRKKRKHSLTPESTVNQIMLNNMGLNIKQEQMDPEPCPSNTVLPSFDHMGQNGALPGEQLDQPPGDGMPYTNTVYQSLKWQPYEQHKWYKLFDRNYKELPTPSFRVEADKGFNFAVADDAFVCQKKNHFQVTVHIGVTAQPSYVQLENGVKAAVNSFHLYLRGIKVEAINSNIRVEQSQADRSKKEFQPVRMELRPNEITKATVGRLHFSETTSNNMRKKGKPNPDQRYFMLVVGVHAHTDNGHYPIASHVSERIIVRASNPGQFESDVDNMWQRGTVQDSVFHPGNVGIKTENAEEALTVHGNVRITGHIMQPSDERAKEAFEELDPKEQLKNIEKLRIMQYKYKQAFAEYSGLPECDRLNVETGVVAQELQEILPDAVYTTGDVHLPTGENIDNFLVVNKDRIYMESIGAVKELCRLNNKLETRINEIEKVNRKLAKLKRIDSLKSTSSGSLSRNGSSRSQASVKSKGHKKPPASWPQDSACLSPRAMQCTMVLLIFIMLFCVITMAVLLVMQMNTGTSQDTVTDPKTSEDSLMNSTSSPSSKTFGTTQPVGTTTESIMSCGGNTCEVYCCALSVMPVTTSGHQDNINQLPQITTTTQQTMNRFIAQSPDTHDGFPGIYNAEQNDKANFTTSEGTQEDDQGRPVLSPTDSRKRKRRASTDDETNNKGGQAPQAAEQDFNITSIFTDVLKGDGLVTEDYCRKPCGLNDNFTYEIPVSVYNSNETASLVVNTSQVTKAKECSRVFSTHQKCRLNIIPASEKSTPSVESQSHSWTISIGNYANGTYSFRFMLHTSAADCKNEVGSGPYKEYNFIFYRDRKQCRTE